MKNIIYLFLLLFIINSCEDNTEVLSESDQKLYLEKGDIISSRSMQTLASEVMTQINENGLQGAVQYCDVHAMPITDSLSNAFNVEIKRTSLKIRNPKDEPTDFEKEILEKYEQESRAITNLEPKVVKIDGHVYYFAPIKIMGDLCLNCHGQPGNTLDQDIYHMIKERYPQDKAIGYTHGELRGMWSIKFKEQ